MSTIRENRATRGNSSTSAERHDELLQCLDLLADALDRIAVALEYNLPEARQNRLDGLMAKHVEDAK